MAAWIRRPIFPLMLGIFLIAIIMFDFFIPRTAVAPAASTLEAWVVIMIAIITWVGLINILRFAVFHVRRRTAGRWPLSIFEIILTVVMLAGGFYAAYVGPAAQTWQNGPIVAWLYTYYYKWGEVALFSIMGFFIAESAYRAFKARSLDATVFMLSAIFALLANISIGGLIWSAIPQAYIWIELQIFVGVVRAITIGVGVGIVAYFVRFLIGKEISAFGAGEGA